VNFQESKVMGIDYGSVRIGIATSDLSRTIAFGKQAIDNNKSSLDKILEIINTENISMIVLGYPLNLKGSKTAQTIEVEKFENELKNYLSKKLDERRIDIVRWDERFTSKIAEDSMLISGMKKKKRQDKSNIDIISAALMLQSYLDQIK
jgi:putative holliday junction resolvase